MVYYVTKRKPQSYNDRGRRPDYKKALSDEFKRSYARLYDGLPYEDADLKTRIVFFHHLHRGSFETDVDNLSKPIVDAFNGVIYKDDGMIVKRDAIKLKLDDFDVMTFEATNMPPKVYKNLFKYFNKKEEYIVLYMVDEIDIKSIKLEEF